VNGYIYANVYHSNSVYKIDFERGEAVEEYNAGNLMKMETNLKTDEVLNGIAYDKRNGVFLLTGKDWRKIHKVHL
jgi:glutamine cyclotransferase